MGGTPTEPTKIPKTDAGAGAGAGQGGIRSPSPVIPLSRTPGSQAPMPVGTPPVVPNIPPRPRSGSISVPLSSSIAGAGRSLSTSFRPTSAGGFKKDNGISRASPKPSTENLGRKTSLSSSKANVSSALTAALGSSPSSSAAITPAISSPPVISRQSSSNLRPDLSRASSGASTPRLAIDKTNATVSGPTPGSAGDSSFSNLADIPDEEKAKVLRRHLVSVEERKAAPATTGNSPPSASPSGTPAGDIEAGDSSISYGATGSHERQETDAFPLPYDAPGGDVTHDLYKWSHDHRPTRPVRSASFSHVPLDRSAILDPTLAHIKEPGGFRRNFVAYRAQEQGLEAPTMVRNVVDFLFLYGHFAGEDLDEDEDDDEEEEDEESFPAIASSEGLHARTPYRSGTGEPAYGPREPSGERRPLLGSRAMSRHRRTRSGPPVGTASVTQAVLMLLKGFVGTGILFMGKAFFNGGILFSSIVLVSIAAISLWSFLLLVQAYMKVPGSFGDIGGALYGNQMRLIILASITISQIGFVAAYTIFIAENLQSFILAVSNCRTYIPVRWLIFAQLIVFLPLAMIRNLAKLSGTALVADAFILIGIIYIASNETSILTSRGMADVALFNKDSFPLLIGTAVFAFEGIGLVIPITESMREPQKFPRVLSGVMFCVAVLFAGAGVMSYATYGSDIQTVVIVNLPQDDKFVQAVQFLYSVAILLSIPLQLFPAVRIMENGLFSKSGKHNPSVKWQKNVFRACTVVFCSLLSWAGSSELDKFVSLIGSFACIPLCFIYPPMLHLKGCATTRRQKILDWILIVFGVVVGAYTTIQTIRSLFIPSGDAPKFGKCQVPDAF